MKPTYEMAQGPPAVPVDVYASTVEEAWRSLLSSNPAEVTVQRFLEDHPALLPSSKGPEGSTSEWPFSNLLVTQPVLPGLNARQPDFLWFTTNSGKWFLVLVFTGMLLIPSRSHVWTIVAGERGTTGVREAVVTAELMNAGRLTIQDYERSWAGDPYDQATTMLTVASFALSPTMSATTSAFRGTRCPRSDVLSPPCPVRYTSSH